MNGTQDGWCTEPVHQGLATLRRAVCVWKEPGAWEEMAPEGGEPEQKQEEGSQGPGRSLPCLRGVGTRPEQVHGRSAGPAVSSQARRQRSEL